MLTKLVIEILLDFRNINISHNVRNTRTSTCQREHTQSSLPIRRCFSHPSMSRNATQKCSFSPFHKKHNRYWCALAIVGYPEHTNPLHMSHQACWTFNAYIVMPQTSPKFIECKIEIAQPGAFSIISIQNFSIIILIANILEWPVGQSVTISHPTRSLLLINGFLCGNNFFITRTTENYSRAKRFMWGKF